MIGSSAYGRLRDARIDTLAMSNPRSAKADGADVANNVKNSNNAMPPIILVENCPTGCTQAQDILAFNPIPIHNHGRDALP